MPTGKPLTYEKKIETISIYNSKPMSIAQCAKISKLSSPTVIKILDEFNIERYAKAKVFNPNMKEDYFHNIDCEHKAYWIGFLITDGNVHIPKDGNRQASISITQKEDRRYILEQFIKDLSINTTVGNDGRGNNCVAIRSNIMANDLYKYGIMQDKTLYTFLPIIRDDLMNHLIRGILDGDGNITSTILKTNKHKHSISFCGTHKLMSDITEYLHSKLNIRANIVYDYSDRHLSEVKWQSIKDCMILGNWLYENATIFIKDKKEKFDDFVNHYNCYGNTELNC